MHYLVPQDLNRYNFKTTFCICMERQLTERVCETKGLKKCRQKLSEGEKVCGTLIKLGLALT